MGPAYDAVWVLLIASPLVALAICLVCDRHRTLFWLAAVPVGLWLVFAVLVAHEILSRQANQTANGEEAFGIFALIMAGVPLGASSIVLLIGGQIRQGQARKREALDADSVADPSEAREGEE